MTDFADFAEFGPAGSASTTQSPYMGQLLKTGFKELAHICVLCSAIASPSLLSSSPIRVNPNLRPWGPVIAFPTASTFNYLTGEYPDDYGRDIFGLAAHPTTLADYCGDESRLFPLVKSSGAVGCLPSRPSWLVRVK